MKVMCCLVTVLLAVIQEALLQEVHLDRLVRFAVAIFSSQPLYYILLSFYAHRMASCCGQGYTYMAI